MGWTWTHEHAAQVTGLWGTACYFTQYGGQRLELILSLSPCRSRARPSLQCRKEPTTTVLQLAALVGTWGHKACQWRTAVGQPMSTLPPTHTTCRKKCEHDISEVKFPVKGTFWRFDFYQLLVSTCDRGSTPLNQTNTDNQNHRQHTNFYIYNTTGKSPEDSLRASGRSTQVPALAWMLLKISRCCTYVVEAFRW